MTSIKESNFFFNSFYLFIQAEVCDRNPVNCLDIFPVFNQNPIDRNILDLGYLYGRLVNETRDTELVTIAYL